MDDPHSHQSIADRLEPGMGDIAKEVPSAILPAILSIAMSLKRIADRLDENTGYTRDGSAFQVKS